MQNILGLFFHNFEFHNSLAYSLLRKLQKLRVKIKIPKVSLKTLHSKAFINILISFACIYMCFICMSGVNNYINVFLHY